MNEKNEQAQGNGCAVVTVLLFLATLGFTFLALYLKNSIANYKPALNETQEGDMVSVFALMLLLGAAGTSLIAAIYSLSVFLLRRHWKKKDSAG